MRAPPSELPIRFDEVTFDAGGITILDRLSLTLDAGAPTLVIGPNGSGKTTLLRMAMGLLSPSCGRVTWDGVTDRPPLRRAIVFQRPIMLRRSVGENIRYALKAAHIAADRQPARIDELLALVGLDGMAQRPARRLSGGEQQRLALARAWRAIRPCCSSMSRLQVSIPPRPNRWRISFAPSRRGGSRW